MSTSVDVWIAAFIVANLLFGVGVWLRASPGSGDRMVLPTVIVLSVSLLLLWLPKVLWPESDRLQISGSIASAILTTIAAISALRRRRRLGQGQRSA